MPGSAIRMTPETFLNFLIISYINLSIMATTEDNMVSFTDAIRRHLYFSLLEGKKHFIDFESESLYWAFNDVDHQLCIALFNGDETDDTLSEKEIYDNIEGRRTEEIDLLVYRDSADGEFLKNFHQITSRKYTFIEPDRLLKTHTKPERSILIKRIDQPAELTSINGLASLFPLGNWLSNTAQLFTRTYFSAWQLYNSGSETSQVLLCMKFEDLCIIEVLELAGTVAADPLKAVELLHEELNVLHLPLLLVSAENMELSADITACSDDVKIDYFNSNGRKKEDINLPKASYSGVLKRKTDYYESLYQLSVSGLPKHNDLPKNWDSFAALSIIMNDAGIPKNSAILDAGGEYYSAIMHQLAAFDFDNLYCINTVFRQSSRIGNIKYTPGDITATKFEDKTFKAITCLSVIEHGVNLDAFFAESSRILADGGLLFLSTDYWHKPVNTHHKEAYGVPVKIFTREDMEHMILQAGKYGLFVPEAVDFKCGNRIIQWEEMRYTFIYLTFYKKK
jgi:SAM-dependent methyltransferase